MTQHKYSWRSSGAIVKNGSILLIHRIKNGREYFILPGGSMEDGESGEQTLIRELQEEASVTVEIIKKMGEFFNNFDNRTHRVYLCKIVRGAVRLGGPEADRHNDDNKYLLEWHPITKLKEIPLVPTEAKDLILSNLT